MKVDDDRNMNDMPARLLATLILSLCGLFASTLTHAAENAPNIVIILADDMGWNDVGYHGSEISTPHIDRLAAEGLELDRFYAQPACSPTRAALLTGKSSQALGIYSPLSKLNPTGLPLTEKLMPAYFRDAGYQTFLVGKWHLGFREPAYRPTARGFDHFYGHLTGGIGFWDHVHGGGLDWQRNGETLREEGYSTHLMAAEIDRLIAQRDPSKPMFLYAAFNAPHLPNEAPEQTIAQYAHIDDPNRRVHAAMVSELDAAIGQLLATLDEQGMLENTLVWFMSDNGGLNPAANSEAMVRWSQRLEDWFGRPLPFTLLEFLRTNALDGGSDNTPLRKGKKSIYEGGARVPSVIYWKGRVSPGLSSQMVTVRDVLPTLLEAVSVPGGDGSIESVADFHGANQWLSMISGVPKQAPDYLINAADGEALYRYPWKLLALKSGDVELYRVDNDPSESVDLSTAQPEKVAELQQALDEYPRGESVHVPLWRSMMDIDFFGGEEDRAPWSEIDGD
jgi:arylsulfatase A-like enzyme